MPFFQSYLSCCAGALDRLASMLTSPLFRADAVEREVSAIHAEYVQVRSLVNFKLDRRPIKSTAEVAGYS